MINAFIESDKICTNVLFSYCKISIYERFKIDMCYACSASTLKKSPREDKGGDSQDEF
jgi:hypothetical protein